MEIQTPEGVTVVQYDEQTYQQIANGVTAFMIEQLKELHTVIGRQHGDGAEQMGEAGPLLQGTLGAVILFMLESGISEERVRRLFDGVLEMMPEFVLSAASLAGRA